MGGPPGAYFSRRTAGDHVPSDSTQRYEHFREADSNGGCPF